MSDLINREDAINALDRIFNFCEEIDNHLPDTEKSGYIMISDYLIIMKYFNQSEERKKGHWIRHPEQKNIYGGKCVECSECGEKYLVEYIEDEKFCRSCGADMRGGEEDV